MMVMDMLASSLLIYSTLYRQGQTSGNRRTESYGSIYLWMAELPGRTYSIPGCAAAIRFFYGLTALSIAFYLRHLNESIYRQG